MEPLTRDQALEKYARNANTIQLLEREQADLKKIIFSTVIKTSEPRLSPQTTRKTGVTNAYKQEVLRVLREADESLSPADIKLLGKFESGSENLFYAVLSDLVKKHFLNKMDGKYSLAIHSDNGVPTAGGR